MFRNCVFRLCRDNVGGCQVQLFSEVIVQRTLVHHICGRVISVCEARVHSFAERHAVFESRFPININSSILLIAIAIRFVPFRGCIEFFKVGCSFVLFFKFKERVLFKLLTQETCEFLQRHIQHFKSLLQSGCNRRFVRQLRGLGKFCFVHLIQLLR